MPRYLGPGQLGECQRCGEKGFAADLVRDGRNPSLLVFSDCYDPPHPQEQPFMFSNTDGVARHEVAPENLPVTAPVLTTAAGGAGEVDLSWTEADTAGPSIESYKVYRATGEGAFTLLDTLEVDYGNGIDDTPVVTTTYTDTGLSAAVLYTYRVDAVTTGDQTIPSNEDEITL